MAAAAMVRAALAPHRAETVKVLIHYLGWAIGIAGPQAQTTEKESQCLVRYALGRDGS